MKLKIFVFLLLFELLTGLALSQIGGRPRELRRAYVAPEEIVSMSRTMPFNQALQIFNDISKKFLGKVIIDPEARTIPIGVDIDRMHWLDALELILRVNKLWYEEYADYIKIVPLTEVTGIPTPTAPTEEEKAKVQFETREVMISAVFFEADAAKLKQYGFSWDFFRGKGVNVGVTMSAGEGKTGLFTIDVTPDLDFGSLVAVFKTLESQQIGEVVANPRIVVRSGEQGQIQVGSDVSTTVRDFAGNAITQFISTGSIIRVKPEVIKFDTIYFISLELNIERSNVAGVAPQITINKSSAQTKILLLDGEETIIGGLYINEERTTREGVPLLKDLPWWFFGLRYLFGFDVKTVAKKELIILLKAEILPSLAERLKEMSLKVGEVPTLKEGREKFLKALENYKKQLKK
ncbi:type IV pilus assembly protein PilQ [Candidatus Kryptonium thompsonii]|uniref:Type IV pilus assembly protein PilQ n=1 Tax=Candidatus Kryptonium thompsonii TaxID=1633631 RepID=A0A0N7MS91_9BACT|nr:type II and III secretion system protein [Candidatus Kryptonium thompsoni]CUS76326.1 type IV pilus assembly protein PilQ [Candidatus Kryptonium thompsoni]CUS79430.1 type IV pilus assembly protein PilQ [Candidatus Kryptonium thompsoni]CUS81626.1 type IV pilus assembly protein PilQ [Candidatus Kryptonium thompsoni]CUS84857.1 type IV pilus assembly protein PilQ [Candidatus Kryptonium thompsoni]CUS86787.1 type IV pilus assembly protein PilQ [Candidatus Kryptonium thompsoni]